MGLKVDLGGQISRTSPFSLFWRFPVHSKHKMDGFYFLIALALIGISIALAKAEPFPPVAENQQITAASNISPKAIATPRRTKERGSAD